MGIGEIDVPCEIISLDCKSIESDFDTLTLRLSNVGDDRREHLRCRRTLEIEQVLRVGPIVVNCTVDTVAEEAEVQTKVGRSGLFPREIGVGHIHRDEICRVIGSGGIYESSCLVGIDSGITGDTPTQTNLQVIHA